MKRGILILIAIVAAVVIAGAAYLLHAKMSFTESVKDTPAVAATQSLRFEIADTDAKQELGLGNRPTIEDNYGMLFVFKSAGRYGFWMKDMLAPIDIVWLSASGTIVLIDHSVEPRTFPHVFYPPVPVPYVLETRAGYAADHGWDYGTQIELPAPYGS